MGRAVSVFVFGVVLFGPQAEAFARGASDPFDDYEDKPEVVTDRVRPMANRLELALFFTPTVAEKYINHLGGAAALSFHLSEVFSLEALGGYLQMSETEIISGSEGVRAKRTADGDPNLPDLVGMNWFAFGNLSIAPIYGKISFLSESDAPNQIYLVAGIGSVGAVRRTRVVGADPLATVQVSLGSRLAGDAGIGVRLFLWPKLAFRAEVRDLFYGDNYDYPGTGKKSFDLIQNFIGFFGLSYLFNG